MLKLRSYFVIASLLIFSNMLFGVNLSAQSASNETESQLRAIVDRMFNNEAVTPEEKLAAYRLYEEEVALRNQENPVIMRTGGPDPFGYAFKDQAETDGPTFNWIQHTTAAHQMTSAEFTTGDDNSVGPINLPFPFPMYGGTLSSIYINTNGHLTESLAAGTLRTYAFPQPTGPRGIYFWCGDMCTYPYSGAGNSRVRYESFISPDTMFVVTYDSLAKYSTAAGRVSAQIILYPNGNIKLQYRDVTGDWSTAPGIGIQSANAVNSLGYGAPLPTNNTAILFYLPCNIVSLNLPLNNALQVPVTTNFQWTGGSCTDYFDVYLGTDQTLVTNIDSSVRVASHTTLSLYDPPDSLLQSTRYYWRVVAIDTGVTPPDIFASTVFTFMSYTPGLEGVKTIGGTDPDYATIHDAISALNGAGTGTGVTFMIRGGTYNEPPDSISITATTGPNNPAIFKVADTLGVIINKTGTTGQPYAFKFANADNIVFDGSHPDAPDRNFMTVNATGTSGQYGFWIDAGSNNCKVKNVNITVGGTTSTFRPIYGYYSTTLGSCANDTVMNCQITGGYYGMYLYGSSSASHTGWYIANNNIVDFNYYGMYLYYFTNATILGNRVHRTSAAANALYGIYASTGTSGNFVGNWVYDLTPSATGSAYGLYSTAGVGRLIANNMINLDATTGGAMYGLYVTTDYAKIAHNTVRIAGTAGGSYNSYALYSSAANTDTIVNNIFINERTGGTTTQYHVVMYMPANPFGYSNNNILSTVTESTTDNLYVARYNAITYNTLSDLRGAPGYVWDAQSLDIPPTFIAPPNLHIPLNSPTIVESAGRPVFDVVTDFDGETRNATTPDIGADEGLFATGEDMIRPSISHEPLLRTQETTSRAAVAIITDNVGVATGANAPRLYHKRSNETTWSFVNATTIQDSLYTFTIPGYPMNAVVQYYIAAQDTSGNVVTSPFGGSGANPPGTIPPTTPHSYNIATILMGTKTIGGVNPDFVSITEAVNALNNIGVGQGGVTFLIRGGTYNEEPNEFLTSIGSSSTSRVCFKAADTSAVIINKTGTSAQPYAFKFSDADDIIFDGSDPAFPGQNLISINAVGTYGYYTLWYDAGTNNCVAKNLNLTITGTTSTYKNIYAYYRTGVPGCANDSIVNCRVTGGYYGMYLYGGSATTQLSGWYVANNDVVDFTYYGMYFYYFTSATVHGNQVHRTSAASNALYGIYGSTGTNGIFTGNWIYNLTPSATGTVYGLYLYYGPGRTIANNIVNLDAATGGSVYGLYVGSEFARIAYNTIRIGGTTSGSYSSYGLYVGSASQDSIANNIIVNERTGGGASYYNVCVYLPTSTTPYAYCDHNLFSNVDTSNTDNRFIIRYNSVNYNTLQATRTAGYNYDANSFDEAPPFVEPPDLHIDPTSTSSVEGNAVPMFGIITDFDNEIRSETVPDIGADESNLANGATGFITGVVRDSIPGMPPVAGVTVTVGRNASITDSLGRYTIEANVGLYDLIAVKPCFARTTITGIQIDSGRTDTFDVFMLRPIFTAPNSFVLYGEPGQTLSENLVIQNTGSAPLQYSLTVLAPWMSASPQQNTIDPHSIGEISVMLSIDSSQQLNTWMANALTFTYNGCPSPITVAVLISVSLGVDNELSAIPKEYKLYQNYPNPFNPSTELRFDLPKSGMTKLTVFDVLGRQVAQLVNQNLNAGRHSVRFDGLRHNAGVYFYRIESGSFSDLKKMVLVK